MGRSPTTMIIQQGNEAAQTRRAHSTARLDEGFARHQRTHLELEVTSCMSPPGPGAYKIASSMIGRSVYPDDSKIKRVTRPNRIPDSEFEFHNQTCQRSARPSCLVSSHRAPNKEHRNEPNIRREYLLTLIQHGYAPLTPSTLSTRPCLVFVFGCACQRFTQVSRCS